jgi:DDE_Tnp_1-associated
MEQATVALEAIGESIVFLDHFKGLPDPRQRGKITYPLGEVLLLCLLAVLGGAETFVDIARFGEKKLDLLRRFRPRTITSAISLPPWTPRPFSAASSPGWQR